MSVEVLRLYFIQIRLCMNETISMWDVFIRRRSERSSSSELYF